MQPGHLKRTVRLRIICMVLFQKDTVPNTNVLNALNVIESLQGRT
jgi:hypothetical protein